ncbi:hypothetical protein L6452_16836 [Arctium lappa]|uniref:Uncharacterized protein n=1 Tax=Arctium lappa TaxID=4217 RepID=A0ACB9C1P2_ARCLA|nr:hypothetical protein L6452_16836 [Arctium lappa]
MARSFPTSGIPESNMFVSFTILFVFIASTIAIASPVCALIKRKKSKEEPNKKDQIKEEKTEEKGEEKPEEKQKEVETEDEDGVSSSWESSQSENEQHSGITRTTSYNVRSNPNSSQGGKLTSCMSTNDGTVRHKKRRKRKRLKKTLTKKLKHENSIVKKPIILGEKCKVPVDDEDPIVYDEKGREISTFHNKEPTVVSLARQYSRVK